MRLATLTLAMFGLTAIVAAADPFVGTWKLNTAKSTYKAGQAPKEQTVTIEEQGGNLNITIKGIAADGSATSSQYTVPVKGGKGTVQQSATYDAVSSKRTNVKTAENSYFREGKQVMTVRVTVSGDGKTQTANVKGTNRQGNPFEGTSVYDKQ